MKRILLIATGGTIAAGETECGLAPTHSAQSILRYVPQIQTICEASAIQLLNLDSTDITPKVWLQIVDCIEKNYHLYDGFVVTHGTDTLSYTAAALSYCVQAAQKPIVLTGSQYPIDAENSDAPENLQNAFLVAVSGITGVVVVFGGRVMAGTRAKKLYTKRKAAFESANFPCLAKIQNGEIQRNPKVAVNAIHPDTAPVFYHSLNPRVAVFFCTPGVSPKSLQAVADTCDGLILETYGLGGIPAYLYSTVESILSSGKVIAVGTQVPFEGTNMSVYKVGKTARTRLPISELRDMTHEAATVKLMWTLAQADNAAEIRRLFEMPIALDRMPE